MQCTYVELGKKELLMRLMETPDRWKVSHIQPRLCIVLTAHKSLRDLTPGGFSLRKLRSQLRYGAQQYYGQQRQAIYHDHKKNTTYLFAGVNVHRATGHWRVIERRADRQVLLSVHIKMLLYQSRDNTLEVAEKSLGTHPRLSHKLYVKSIIIYVFKNNFNHTLKYAYFSSWTNYTQPSHTYTFHSFGTTIVLILFHFMLSDVKIQIAYCTQLNFNTFFT